MRGLSYQKIKKIMRGLNLWVNERRNPIKSAGSSIPRGVGRGGLNG